jgi:hypothetical protein
MNERVRVRSVVRHNQELQLTQWASASTLARATISHDHQVVRPFSRAAEF